MQEGEREEAAHTGFSLGVQAAQPLTIENGTTTAGLGQGSGETEEPGAPALLLRKRKQGKVFNRAPRHQTDTRNIRLCHRHRPGMTAVPAKGTPKVAVIRDEQTWG